MTNKEHKRARVIGYASDGALTNRETSEQLGISIRQVIRLKKRFVEDGIKGMIHGNADRKPKHALAGEVKSKVLKLF